MAYCTDQDLIDRFGEDEIIYRTDKSKTGQIDYAVLEKAIADADAEINSYLTNYQLPLENVPANFAKLAADITRKKLFDNQLVDYVEEPYKMALIYLDKVARGLYKLPSDANGERQPQSDGPVLLSNDPAKFGVDSFSIW